MSFEIKINNEKEWKEVNINGLSYVISNYGDVVTLSNRSHKIVPHLNKDGYPIVTVGKILELENQFIYWLLCYL